ncbi:TMEM175 family protein [Nocardioides oleivorans]|nr:TMEM175 family protein [Nocardioides oleivorans]
MAGDEVVEHRSAERLTFFTDAVVAIAMTLLVLPLTEAVSETASEGLSTADYLRDHSDQLFAFALSFAIISTFWRAHHRLFEHVAAYSQPLMLLNIVWMFTIVWLPVPTALAGSLETDRPQLALYIGSMLANALVSVALHVVLRRNPALWVADNPPNSSGTYGLLTFAVLLTLALVIALVLPGVGYLSLLVLVLSGPIERLLFRR